tara:strand:+ start:583 stop:1365 length:783 start_codon:yes stop_codon:yes gene_type:complete
MPYLGNIPASEFRNIDYQDFTGVTGSPVKRGFTLTSPVSNANDLEVFVNNVRQEPGVAYTVAGTTLTMTGDVETTDDFYIVYQGKAVASVVPPDGSVSSAKLDTNIAISGNLDVGGRILTPARPAFHVVKTGSEQATSGTTLINWTTEVTDVGNHFSLTDNDYTIPVTGMYFLQCTVRCAGDSGTMEHAIIHTYVDGSLSKTLIQIQTANNQLKNSVVNGSVVMSLNAGQKVSFYANISATNPLIGVGTNSTYCSGFLIG